MFLDVFSSTIPTNVDTAKDVELRFIMKWGHAELLYAASGQYFQVKIKLVAHSMSKL